MNPSEPLWHCPSCGRPFVRPNHPHSCGEFSVERFLKGKTPAELSVFKKFCEMVGACGPFTFAPAKTRVGFQVRMIFAAVNSLSARGMRCHFVFARRVKHPRFIKIEKLRDRCYVNHFVITKPDELDAEVAEWLNESYKVGAQEHLKKL